MNRSFLGKWLAIAGLVAMAAIGAAQYASDKIQLQSHIDLTTFGSANGNGCWGYVSPSGREYALMGLSNKLAFVDITNPTAPNWFASIPHANNLWADIKVYQNYAYICTELAGSGIQVIDLSLIDQHIVTLVRTITSPGRSHTLALDPVSGFLYTCGSNNGTGTTMCFSLANPANPVQVGPASMTTAYQHEATVVTYTSGPYAGKQIWFGFGEGRGVEIYDFTNKNAPVKIRTATYPNMGYCHQGWLSADRKYLYVDDEFDENNLSVPTRSLMFNVEDPANATYIGSFTTGISCIDHNQYVDDGFTFQANYRGGLFVFDLADTPTAPVMKGFFDSYPSDSLRGYNGAWSNYPFFPSGNVIISDIEGGLFVVDPTQAVTRDRALTSMTVPVGLLVGGSITELSSSDNLRVGLTWDTAADLDDYPIHLVTTATSVDNDPQAIKFVVESRASAAGYGQRVELFDWTANAYVAIDNSLIGTTDQTVTINAPNPARFVNPTTLQMKARVRWIPLAVEELTMGIDVDEISFLVVR